MDIRRLHRSTVKRVAFTAAGIMVGVAGITAGTLRQSTADEAPVPAAQPGTEVVSGALGYRRLADPARTVVTDDSGRVVAMLTDGARTANLLGPVRRFAEPATTAASVTSRAWVRVLPQPWGIGAEHAPWFRPWLEAALRDRSPDILAAATEYLPGSQSQIDARGHRYGGDPRFGVLDVNADGRAERSDFNDYLATAWTFPDGRTEPSDPARGGAIDDSGFVRLVFGYRSGLPLRADNDAPADGIARGTGAIASSGPGAMIVANRHVPVSDFGRLQPGDLVFFDVDPDRQVDDVGIYLGVDDGGHHRFVASREAADGPTMGDAGGAAVLDGGGDYATAFRSVKRL